MVCSDTAVSVSITAGSVLACVWLLARRRRDKAGGKAAWATLVGQAPELTAASPGVRMLTSLSRAPAPTVSGGHPRPTLVLIHGLGCNSLEWSSVRNRLSDKGMSADVFAYDRILFVEGGSLPRPRSAVQLAEELRTLLENRGLAPPFVLVGHSYGGLVAQCFAMLRPAHVAGLVLVDTAHECQNEAFPRDFAFSFKLMPILFWMYRTIFAPFGMLRLMDRLSLFNFPPLFLYPAPERAASRDLYSDGVVWERTSAELAGFNVTMQDMGPFRKRYAPLPISLPCKLIIAADRKFAPTRYPDKVTTAYLDLHRDLCSHLSIEPILATESDHWVHLQQPELVAQAILDVLAQVA